MKKIKFENKLSLKKETVTRLNGAQLNNLKGGAGQTLSNCPGPNGCIPSARVCATVACLSAVCGGHSNQTLCPSVQYSVCNELCP
jgi:hypothetical protein